MVTCIAARLDFTSHERALMSVKRGSEESMRKVQRSLLALALLAPFVLGASPPAQAQSWPQRTVKFLLPLGQGRESISAHACWRIDSPRAGANRSWSRIAPEATALSPSAPSS